MTYEKHFTSTLDLIEKYQGLINCHLVDFLTEDLWDKFVPLSIKLEVEKITSVNSKVDWWKTELCSELNNFKNMAQSLKLDACLGVTDFKDLTMIFPETVNNKLNNFPRREESKYMKQKKLYEIDIFSKIIAHVFKTDFNVVVDAGSGKAYLSQYLSEVYGIPVLAIESSTSHYNNALMRKNLLQKKLGLSFPKVS